MEKQITIPIASSTPCCSSNACLQGRIKCPTPQACEMADDEISLQSEDVMYALAGWAMNALGLALVILILTWIAIGVWEVIK